MPGLLLEETDEALVRPNWRFKVFELKAPDVQLPVGG